MASGDPSLKEVKNNLQTELRADYEKYFNPEMWRAHLYVIIGIGAFILLSPLSDSSTGIGRGLLFATAIFAFHEYMGQQINNLLKSLSSRFDPPYSLFNFSTPFTTAIICTIDLLIAVPMFGFTEYSESVIQLILALFFFWFLQSFLSGC